MEAPEDIVLSQNTLHSEVQRIDAIYAARGYDTDPTYNDFNSVYLHRMQSMERAMLDALKRGNLDKRFCDLKILDYGCGNGRWLGRWMAWGASASNLAGVDLRSKCIQLAIQNLSTCRFDVLKDGTIPFADSSFDIVAQNVVFSSILDDGLRRKAAVEMQRILKPGGHILWCDFIYSNPRNSNVRPVTKRDIHCLFPEVDVVVMKKIILAPPIARILVPMSWLAAEMAEFCFPFLRTHVAALLRKS